MNIPTLFHPARSLADAFREVPLRMAVCSVLLILFLVVFGYTGDPAKAFFAASAVGILPAAAHLGLTKDADLPIQWPILEVGAAVGATIVGLFLIVHKPVGAGVLAGLAVFAAFGGFALLTRRPA